MSHKELEKILLSFENTKLDYPFGPDVAVYKAKVKDDWKMFALIPEKSNPTRISLKCDPKLAEILREKYITVMEGYHLNKKHWNTIILSGEIADDEIRSFIRHSYDLVIGSKNAYPEV